MLGLGKALRGLVARLEAKSSTVRLKVKVKVTAALRANASMQASTPVIYRDHAGPMQLRYLRVFDKDPSIVCALPLGGVSATIWCTL